MCVKKLTFWWESWVHTQQQRIFFFSFIIAHVNFIATSFDNLIFFFLSLVMITIETIMITHLVRRFETSCVSCQQCADRQIGKWQRWIPPIINEKCLNIWITQDHRFVLYYKLFDTWRSCHFSFYWPAFLYPFTMTVVKRKKIKRDMRALENTRSYSSLKSSILKYLNNELV